MTFPCDVCNSSMMILTSVKDKCLWSIQILSRSTDMVATKLSEIITGEGGKVCLFTESLYLIHKILPYFCVYNTHFSFRYLVGTHLKTEGVVEKPVSHSMQ